MPSSLTGELLTDEADDSLGASPFVPKEAGS